MTNLDMTSLASIHTSIDFTSFSRGKRQRAGKMDLASLILGLLHADGVLRMEEIRIATGYSASVLRKEMKALIAAGLVVSSGRTRGTCYMVAS